MKLNETLGAAERAEMAGVEQVKKSVPLVKCEITFGQHGNMPHCWTSTFDYHLNHGFIVLKNKKT